MLGPIGSEIMSIFRLLSPDEIDKYIVEEKANSYRTGETAAIAANDGGMALSPEHANMASTDDSEGNKFPKDHQAKIIPLNQRDSDEEKHDPYKSRPQASENESGELASIGVLSASKIKEIERDRLEREKKKRDSATVFLLKERERMRSAKRRLIEQTAIKSYQTNASQEFLEETEEEIESEEHSTNDLKGILLNKKHF